MTIKVGDVPQFEPGGPHPVGPGAPKDRADPLAFRQQLAYHSNLDPAEPADIHMRRVDEEAKRLLANPTMAGIAAYREAVRKFLKAVSDKLGKLDKRTDRRNRTLVIIRSLDDKLEDLTRAVLEDQEKGLDLLARLNEIRGMLLDLLI
ncbi:MAG: DUF327 family protein [Candidatus Sericytochromatia bacterium]|nr:DUF327 family protein [Candidatus Tanganyikabacteria bacterium]